ncbi:feruloyl esterase A precursor, putative [Metarhizium acridum CQMa 102]|uniref:Feruloyl esterase A, putative n=1 Tax=Metarhizium acridum (strain CQMa 102) TaxID=655827 RepID=E9ED01_METAQ|nr:feruloyl esterase A precursor, putative [Metarhizium acridum CQMa 102]EFY86226.1 feruloyl esterase A precursor, putative [Metarhizium acridum CQMa 102]
MMLSVILGLPLVALALATPVSNNANDVDGTSGGTSDGTPDDVARVLERGFLPTDLAGVVKVLEKGLPPDIPSEVAAIAAILEQGPPRTQVSSGVYEKLSYYAQFPGSATVCVHKPAEGIVEQLYVNETTTDTQAMIYRLDSRKELILAIPGTQSGRDWDTDYNWRLVDYKSCESCKAHHGFLTAWESIADEVERGLESALRSYPGYSVTIVGHSLGGALAELAFGSLKPKPLSVSQVITYGAPRVGNTGFADYIDKLAGASNSDAGISYRVTHYDDTVPHLPPFFFGFTHPRTEYWQSADKPAEASTYRCYGHESLDCIFGRVPSSKSDAHGTYAGMKPFC